MTATPPISGEDSIGESWVDLSLHTSDLPSPPLGSIHNGEMHRLLLEAQRESNQSSARVSGASSRKGSPKSPPNSPSAELSVEELKDVFINKELHILEKNTDWVWDWSSRPDQQPPKEWKFKHPKGGRLSMRHSKALKSGLLSGEVLSIMLLTNLMSLLLGAGIGIFIGKRMASVSTFALD